MTTLSFWKTSGLAMVGAVLALSAAFVMGGVVRHEDRRGSRQQPVVDPWFERQTPTSARMVLRGRALFLDSCAHCHGADARGDEGPDLHDLQVSDRYIARVIKYGIPHEMPAFAKKHDVADLMELIAYVRSLE